MKSNIKTHLIDTTMKYETKTAAQAVTLWAMQVRQPHFSFLSPAHFISDIAEVSPCLGYEYCDNLLALTAEELINKNIYKLLIFNGFSRLKSVVYANTGELLNGNFKFPISSSKSFLKGVIPNTLKDGLKRLLVNDSASDFDKAILTKELVTEFIKKVEIIGEYSDILDPLKFLIFVCHLRKIILIQEKIINFSNI